MYFSSNLQFLRRRSGITQENLAQQLGVSRQAISKWESGESVPEVSTLLQLAHLLSCTLDDLLQQDLSLPHSSVRIVTVRGFRMAHYCMISPNAYEDVQLHLKRWAGQQELENPILLLWSFPYVTEEQKQRFSLEGFEAVCVVPENFSTEEKSCTIRSQPDCTYAVLTLSESGGRSKSQIAGGIRIILEHLQNNGIRKTAAAGFLPCFEHRYTKNGLSWVDLFLQCQEAPASEIITL